MLKIITFSRANKGTDSSLATNINVDNSSRHESSTTSSEPSCIHNKLAKLAAAAFSLSPPFLRARSMESEIVIRLKKIGTFITIPVHIIF